MAPRDFLGGDCSGPGGSDRSRLPWIRAHDLLPWAGASARRVHMSIRALKLLGRNAAGAPPEVLQGNSARDSMDAACQDAARFSHPRESAQTAGEYFVISYLF